MAIAIYLPTSVNSSAQSTYLGELLTAIPIWTFSAYTKRHFTRRQNTNKEQAQCKNTEPVHQMGAGGFEPPNANARGFTIPVLWPLGYTPGQHLTA